MSDEGDVRLVTDEEGAREEAEAQAYFDSLSQIASVKQENQERLEAIQHAMRGWKKAGTSRDGAIEPSPTPFFLRLWQRLVAAGAVVEHEEDLLMVEEELHESRETVHDPHTVHLLAAPPGPDTWVVRNHCWPSSISFTDALWPWSKLRDAVRTDVP